MKSSELKPNRRILIVDDNTSIHADFRKILCPAKPNPAALDEMEAALFGEEQAVDQTGFELDSAFQGQEALELVKKSLAENRPYAMAFVDVRMPPGWDGVETIARIWEVYPELQIVVCTAYSDYSWEEMRARVGQPDSLLVLKKPFDNIEVQQLAHALTKKWLLNIQSRSQVTELEQVNRSLVLSEERFSKAFHESPLPSGIQSFHDQRFVDVNQRLAEITGFKREEMIGRTPAELGMWEKPEVADQWYEDLQHQASVQDKEANIRNQTGGLHEVLVSVSPLALGQQPYVLLLAQDVAQRAALERLLRQSQKMEAIGQLASGITHDVNNALSPVVGFTDLMARTEEGLSSRGKRYLQHIQTAAEDIAHIVARLREFYRRRDDRESSLALDINRLVEQVVDMTRPRWRDIPQANGITVEVQTEFASNVPDLIGIESEVREAITNLIFNAIDALPEGGTVTLRTRVTRGDVHLTSAQYLTHIVVEVADTGTGMNEETRKRCLEPFFTTKGRRGTGLGLAMVYGVMRRHEGSVEIDSELGKGTTFRLVFPVRKPAAARPVAQPGKVHPANSLQILCIDDEPLLRDLLKEMLERDGHKVKVSDGGQTGLDAFRSSRSGGKAFDIVITDLGMPYVDGRQVARAIKSESPETPVIMLTGWGESIQEDESGPTNVDALLGKPPRSKDLRDTLSRLASVCKS